MLYVRLYIDEKTKQIMGCEADENPIERELIQMASVPEGLDFKDGDVLNIEEESLVRPRVVCFELEDLTGGQLPEISARDFVEDISDDGEASFGSSILKVNDDFTVSLCSKGASGNNGNIQNCKGIKINNCEVMSYGN